MPSIIAASHNVGVAFVFANRGTTTWTTNGEYSLKILDDPCSLFAGSISIPLNEYEPIPPNMRTQFIGEIVIPEGMGGCPIQIQLAQEGVGFFGRPVTLQLRIEPAANAAADWSEYD